VPAMASGGPCVRSIHAKCSVENFDAVMQTLAICL
jgi:hypothetical protein